jgi:hypothetical protein
MELNGKENALGPDEWIRTKTSGGWERRVIMKRKSDRVEITRKNKRGNIKKQRVRAGGWSE